jgi:transglutaminase-like putative cysteine protease
MRIRLGYDIGYRFEQPTPMIVTLNVHYGRASDLERPDTMVTSPPVPYVSYRDGFGNWCNRVTAPAGDFTLRADTVIRDPGVLDPGPFVGEQQMPVENLPQETLVFLLASRYCESDALSEFAWKTFGHAAKGWPLVQAISSYVHEHVVFDHTAARPTKTAVETLHEGRGVCRDYAHLGVALCRAMNIPARYCTGYLGDIGVPPSSDPMDFSGWFEVYLSGGWHTVDPRNLVPRIGRVLIAQGRDAADVAIATTFGPNVLTRFTVWTEELTDEH